MNNIAGRLDILKQLLDMGVIDSQEVIKIFNMTNLNPEKFDSKAKELYDIAYSKKFKEVINENS